MTLPAFDALSETLRSVRTRPLFVMQLLVKPMQVLGATPAGGRRIGVITGGTFAGERLSGEVLDGGSDWQRVHPESVTLDVRLVLKTSSGVHIALRYRGYRHGPKETLARIDRGAAVPAEYYFRTQAWFETAAGEFEWLNRVLAIGVGERCADGPVYSLFEIL